MTNKCQLTKANKRKNAQISRHIKVHSVLIHTVRRLKFVYLFLPAGPLFEIFFERPISPAAAILCLTAKVQSVTGFVLEGRETD